MCIVIPFIADTEATMPDYPFYDDIFEDAAYSYRTAYPRRAEYGAARARTYSGKKDVTGVISVADAVETLRGAVSPLLGGLWIKGEVSNISRPASGHVYFTIKDGQAQIRCVYFLYAARRHPADFRIGDLIEVQGSPDIYSKSGDLQIKLNGWRRAGMGELFEAYLRLKEKLRREGFFDESGKKRLPIFPKDVVVVTSAQAAALQDVIKTVSRRMPWVRLRLSPAYVQGADAPSSLIDALDAAERAAPDVILLVRGGGSFEDLMAFNDERLVRFMKTLSTPVIAGIGHESDETLAGLAADVTASTPTAAAEHLGCDRLYWQDLLETFEKRMSSDLHRKIDSYAQMLDDGESRLGNMPSYLNTREEELIRSVRRISTLVNGRLSEADRALSKIELFKAFGAAVRNREERLSRSAERLRSPDMLFEAKISRMEKTAVRLSGTIGTKLDRASLDLEKLAGMMTSGVSREISSRERDFNRAARNMPDASALFSSYERELSGIGKTLDALDPDRPLRAGYVRAEKNGIPLSSALETKTGDSLRLVFADGGVDVSVENVVPLK